MRRLLLFPLALAAVAVLTLWLIEVSPLSESAKEHLRRVVSVGFAMAIIAFLVLVSLVGLPGIFGVVAASAVLAGSGAAAITLKLAREQVPPPPDVECPPPGVLLDGFCYALYSPIER